MIENTNIKEKLDHFVSRSDTFSLGVCNGCQLMIKLGIFGSGVEIEKNTSGRFESRFSYVEVFDNSDQRKKIENTFFSGMGISKLGIWVAHGEGRFVFKKYNTNVHIPLKYVDVYGNISMRYPYNPNGSMHSAAAISTIDGRHLAMMPHPERTIMPWQAPWIPDHWSRYKYYPWLYMFISAYKWCTRNSARK